MFLLPGTVGVVLTEVEGNTQSAANYMLSVSVIIMTWMDYMRLMRQELTVFNVDFPTETTDVKFRTLQWIVTEVLLALAALLNFMPRTSPCFLAIYQHVQ